MLENITLLRPPPYAPELNAMENIWDYLRCNKLSSLVCDTYEAIRDASREAWNFIAVSVRGPTCSGLAGSRRIC